MRVLHLNAGYLYGGIETYLVTLARLRHLAPEMEPEFGLCFRGRVWDELASAGVPVHDLGPVRLSRPWTVWRARRRLRRALTGVDTAVVHGLWVHTAFAPAVNGRARLVTAIHGLENPNGRLPRLASRTRPALLLANSRFTAESAARVFRGVPAAVVYPPTPAPAIGPSLRERLRAETGTSRDAVVILQVSRMEALKGHAVLIDALSRLVNVSRWACWIVGDAQRPAEQVYLDGLRDFVARAGIEHRIRFLGARSDVPALLAAADVYCQPNTAPEGFGLTFVEALYAGLPVVTSGLGGAAEIVDARCGVLTPPGDAVALAETLRELIRDAGLRVKLAAAGPTRAAALCDPRRQLAQWSENLCGRRAA